MPFIIIIINNYYYNYLNRIILFTLIIFKIHGNISETVYTKRYKARVQEGITSQLILVQQNIIM